MPLSAFNAPLDPTLLARGVKPSVTKNPSMSGGFGGSWTPEQQKALQGGLGSLSSLISATGAPAYGMPSTNWFTADPNRGYLPFTTEMTGDMGRINKLIQEFESAMPAERNLLAAAHRSSREAAARGLTGPIAASLSQQAQQDVANQYEQYRQSMLQGLLSQRIQLAMQMQQAEAQRRREMAEMYAADQARRGQGLSTGLQLGSSLGSLFGPIGTIFGTAAGGIIGGGYDAATGNMRDAPTGGQNWVPWG